MRIKYTWPDNEDETAPPGLEFDEEGRRFYHFPAHYVVCHDCQGKGTTYLGWPASEQPAFTADDFAEDPEFACDYMDGHYDRACPACDGERVVPEIDKAYFTPRDTEAFNSYVKWVRDEAAYQAMCAAERRMGA